MYPLRSGVDLLQMMLTHCQSHELPNVFVESALNYHMGTCAETTASRSDDADGLDAGPSRVQARLNRYDGLSRVWVGYAAPPFGQAIPRSQRTSRCQGQRAARLRHLA